MVTIRVFVSSTWLGLQPYQKAVEDVLQRMRETKFIGMAYFGSRDETTRKTSLAEAEQSDVHIGQFGGRYGSGITEAEYRRRRHGAADSPEGRSLELQHYLPELMSLVQGSAGAAQFYAAVSR